MKRSRYRTLASVAASRASVRLFVPVVVVGAGLAAFDFFSASSPVAKRGLIADKPPVYGRFEPGFSRLGAYALALVVVAGIGAYLVARPTRVRPAAVLLGVCGFALAFSAAVAVVNGSTRAYTDPFERKRPADYQQDVHLVRELGVRGFIREHPKILTEFTAVHSKTHPPGPVVFFSFLQNLFPKHLVPRAIVIAFLGSLVAIPTWFLTRAFAGERAATVAAAMIAVAPAPIIFSFTSMDAVFMTMLATVAALLVWSIHRPERTGLAIAAGVAAAAATFFTYAVAFVAGFAVIYAFLVLPRGRALRTMAVVGAAAVAVLVAMRIVLGFDPFASYRASFRALPDDNARNYWYWLFGNIAVWLTFAGVSIAGLSAWEFLVRRPRYLIALYLPLMAANLTRIFPAETERVGMFAYPFIAAAAGIALTRWEDDTGRKRPGALAVLVVIAALQTVLLEALYYNFW
jgi:hypothetical protein